MFKKLTAVLGIVVASLFMAYPAFGSDYPDRPITFYTMVQPGAQIDLLARGMAKRFGDILGQPINVRNVPGGSHGSVMATELSKAKADGYTLGVAATTAYTYAPHHAKTQYSTFDDFTFVTLLALNSSGFLAAADAPYDTLKEAFEWARANEEELVCIFHGADDRDAIQRIAKKEGVNISLIPSRGGPSVIKAVTGGHADIGYAGAILYQHVEAGRIKLLASALNKRLPPIPDVPTLKEQGYDEAVQMYVALVAPDGLPDDVIAKLQDAVDELSEDEGTQDFITGELQMISVEWGHDYAKQYIRDSYNRFKKLAQQ